MALLNWKDEYSVNIKEIDTQHKKLIEMINQLHDAMKEQRGKEALKPVLQQLITYCGTHFAVEEKLMLAHAYPEFNEHRDKHLKMTQKVRALQEDVNSGKASITIEVMNFLKDWLDKHILGTDKKYSPYLNSKGVS